MTTASDQRLIADSTELVLDRLEAWLAGDQQRVAQIDAAAPKDTRALAAMWSAAFGVAERSLNVMRARDPQDVHDVLQSFREQVEEYRRL